MTVLQDRIARGNALMRFEDQELRRLAGLLWDEYRRTDLVRFEELSASSQNRWLRVARAAVRHAGDRRGDCR